MRSRKRQIGLALFAGALIVAIGVYEWLFAGLPSPSDLPSRLAAPSSRIYDRTGRLLYEISDPESGRNQPVPLEQISPILRQATLATEDADFYHNPGVDVRGIVRALWINLRGGEVLAGGSTITQQIARNLLLEPGERGQRTLRRKLRETFLAWQLTRQYSKDDLLALYLNQTYYGNTAYGIEAAARTYFGKPAADLDLAEATLLAGLPQAPSDDDPLVHPDAAHHRQSVVLDLLVQHGIITVRQANQARNEPLHFAASPFAIHAPHFVMMVWNQLAEDYGADTVRRGGLVVTTTLDLAWQQAAEEIARRTLQRLSAPDAEGQGHRATDAALVALNPQTGEVLALVGSPDYFNATISGAVNVALAPRQPGSAIKPITYAAAFTPGRPDTWTPATMILDVRSSFPTREGLPFVPENYDRQFHGPVSARQALASSLNVPAVKTLDHVGLETMLRLARALGLRTLEDESHYGLSLTLGGGEVRLLDLTAVYAAFANGGHALQPVTILEVRDSRGQLLHRWQPAPAEPVLDPRVAYLITDILSDNQARSLSFGLNSVLQLSRPAAVKTGTTTDFRDNWTVGYTPDLVTGVWVGNADGSPMENVTGVAGAGPIWHDFMETALKDRPPAQFPIPPGLTRMEICTLSGLRPTPACPLRRTEWFIARTEPTQDDHLYRLVHLDRATGLPADASTPPTRVEDRVFLFLPPEAQEWAHQQGIPEPPVGIHDQLPVMDNRPPITGLALISPDPGTVYALSPLLPAAEQKVPITARVDVSVREVTLLADGQLLARLSDAPYQTFWQLTPGRHVFTAQGVDADGRSWQSAPVWVTVQ